MDATPQDKLKTTTLGNLTQTQIHDTASTTFVNRPGASRIVRDIHDTKLAISTFGGGGIIPSMGEVKSTTFADLPIAVSSTLRPAAGEVWRIAFDMLTVVNASGSTNTITLQLEDADGNAAFDISGTVAASTTSQPFTAVAARAWWITESLFIRLTGNQSETCTVTLPVQYEAF